MAVLFHALRLGCLALFGLALGAQGLRMPMVRVAGSQEPVRIQTLSIEVQVTGSLATTTWDLTVFNPQDRILEGELLFPLGEGQTVSRFALDVNGRLREGSVVEKAKGRQVFEAIVRRGVDPGLLEKVEGNAFRARVYPVPARGSRRIVLAYEQELPFAARSEGEALRYHLPFAFAEPIPSFTFKVLVHEQELAPKLESSPLPGLAFRRWQRAYVAEERRDNARLDQPLTVLLPRPPDAKALFLERDGGHFALALNPRLPKEPKTLPGRLLLLFDASASARQRDRGRERAVLDAYFRRIGSASVRLVVFRDQPEPARDFTLRGGQWTELRKALESAPLDGATAFGRLDLGNESADEVLLLSDGLNTLGDAEPRLPKAPLTALASAALGDPARLRALAERQGGELIDLTRTTDAEALAELTTRPLAFLRASYAPGAVEELYPSGGQVLRGSFLLTGRLLRPAAKLTLYFGYGGRTRFTREVSLAREEGSEAPVRRLWAQKKLAELELDRVRNARAIVALGKEFGLVTEGTSLIVLEDIQDYLRYRIEPPADLRAEFDRLSGLALQREGDREKAHLAQVLKAFEERQRWWETVFKPVEPKPEPKRNGQANAVVEVVASTAAADRAERRAEAAPPPAPAAMAPGLAGGGPLAKSARRDGDREKPEEASGTRGRIELKAWNPDTPYLKALEAASKDERYAVYLRLRDDFGGTPGYYLDVADLFERQGDRALSRRILSNLAELKLEDPALLRVFGWRLLQLGEPGLAVWVLEQVLRLREEEPQSRRDLGLALAALGEPQRAAGLLWDAVRIPSDGRFRDVHLIALGELNALLATTPQRLVIPGMDRAFQRSLPVDVRVVLNWDTPDSDMDLHVIDPRGETCYYSHPRTAIGGRISADVTQGYGPEEFLLKKAIPGRYTIKAKFFGTRQQTVVGATTVRLELFLHHGTARVENKGALVRLTGQGRMVDVGEFVIEGN